MLTSEKFNNGFTLLEILLAVTILSIVSTVTFMTFSAATTAWQRGTALVDRLHHGDFVMNQLCMALRSAYYPDTDRAAAVGGRFGFQFEDNGDGPSAQDEISWVKLGGALVGRDQPDAGSPHRVRFFLREDEDGRTSAAITWWRLAGQPPDFDPDDLDPIFLSSRIKGFNCRMGTETNSSGEIEWKDESPDTNKIPSVVEVTLYLEPVEIGEKPLEIKRIVGLRAAELAWTP
jgi:prepilin-type N-terminal cleavage/methylation domain-containing protein